MELQSEQSDIVALWQKALDDYDRICGVEIRSLLENRSVKDIMENQKHEFEKWNKFRHPSKNKTDRIRTLITKNLYFIESGLCNLANAASVTFPPSSAILVAFTSVISASKKVSGDYDLIESFFDLMSCFFQRLQLLEGKIKALRTDLMKVFSSMLIMSGHAHVCSSQGRFHAWAKAFVSDPKSENDPLRKSYAAVQDNIKNLESAVMLQTLSVVMDVSDNTEDILEGLTSLRNAIERDTTLTKEVRQAVLQNIDLSMRLQKTTDESLSVNLEIKSMMVEMAEQGRVESHILQKKIDLGFGELAKQGRERGQVQMEISSAIGELIEETHEYRGKLDQFFTHHDAILRENKRRAAGRPEQQGENKAEQNLEKKVGRSTILTHLKETLKIGNIPEYIQRRLRELQDIIDPSIFSWIEEEPAFQDVIQNKAPFLWVSGDSGMGKSTMSLKILGNLKEQFLNDSSVFVVWYFFARENDDMCTISSVIKWCALRVAQANPEYCEEILRHLREVKRRKKMGLDLHDQNDTPKWEKHWNKLLRARFTKSLDRRLILILDGVDEVEDEILDGLLSLLRKIKADKDCAIQIIMTGRKLEAETKDSDEGLSSVMAERARVDLNKVKVAGDLVSFAKYLTKTTPRLKRLRRKLKFSIATKVADIADSFRYVHYTIQRLSRIGLESAISKELSQLPPNTPALFEKLLIDCLGNRNIKDRELLREFLVWPTYVDYQLSLSEANELIGVIRDEQSISIDEVMEGPLSRLLRISNSAGMQLAEGDTDAEGSVFGPSGGQEDSEDEETRRTEEGAVFLQFQDRTMQANFRDAMNDKLGLRCSETEAHVIIFKHCTALLTLESSGDPWTILNCPNNCNNLAQANLIRYASLWCLWRFMQIEVDKVDDELAKVVLESVFRLLSNVGHGLRHLEVTSGSKSYTVLEQNEVDENEVVDRLAQWAKRALALPAGTLKKEILEWFNPLVEEPKMIFLSLAKDHVRNWYTAQRGTGAVKSFRRAHRAILEAKDLPSLKDNEKLHEHLEVFDEDETEFSSYYKPIDMVLNLFDDIEQNGNAYVAISLTLRRCGHSEEAIARVNEALKLDDVTAEQRSFLLCEKGLATYHLYQRAETQEEKMKHLKESVAFLGEGIACYKSRAAGSETTDNVRALIPFYAGRRARCWMGLKDFKSAVETVKLLTQDPFGLIFHDSAAATIPREVLDKCVEAGEYHHALDLLKSLPKLDLTNVFSEDDQTFHDSIQKCAQRSGEGESLLGLYARVAKALVTPRWRRYNTRSFVQLQAALFARKAMGDPKKAEKLLWEMVRDPQTPLGYIERAYYALADIFLEEFRLTCDPKVKNQALQRTKALQVNLAGTFGTKFKLAESPISITLAHMLRKLGPAIQFADTINDVFQSCMRLLTDDIDFNDWESLRLLSVVLGSVKGFQTEAEIALTSQFYMFDTGIHEEVKEAEGVHLDTKTLVEGGEQRDPKQEIDENPEKERGENFEPKQEEKIVDPLEGEMGKAAEVKGSPEQGEESFVYVFEDVEDEVSKVDYWSLETGKAEKLQQKPIGKEDNVTMGATATDVNATGSSNGLLQERETAPKGALAAVSAETTAETKKIMNEEALKFGNYTKINEEALEEAMAKLHNSESEPETPVFEESDTNNPMSMGLRSDHSFVCHSCRKKIFNWLVGDTAYRCIYCIDLDICGDCFAERAQRKDIEKEKEDSEKSKRAKDEDEKNKHEEKGKESKEKNEDVSLMEGVEKKEEETNEVEVEHTDEEAKELHAGDNLDMKNNIGEIIFEEQKNSDVTDAKNTTDEMKEKGNRDGLDNKNEESDDVPDEADNEGKENEPELHWRVVCPQGHKHVKAPVDGWRGVKGNKLRIGDKDILFSDWLKDLEAKWKAHWDDFWADQDIS